MLKKKNNNKERMRRRISWDELHVFFMRFIVSFFTSLESSISFLK